MRKPRLRTVLIATGAAVALVAGSTAAYAAIAGPVNGTGVISGCYTTKALNGSHVFVLQDAGTNCPAGTTAISWNQQGQPGPAGPAGPAGATGAAGATGPAGPIGATGPQGPPGTSGTSGTNGTNGTNGANVMTSQGAPTGTCTPGDSDIELSSGPSGNGEVWTCSSGAAWNDTGSSIQGPAGPQGPQGASGPDCSAPGPGANMVECNFYLSTALEHVDLTGANLAGANLAGANLAYANLAGAILPDAILPGAYLAVANLPGANLANANLSGATLTGANLDGADLTGAGLYNVTWSNTICPDGSNSDYDGDTCATDL